MKQIPLQLWLAFFGFVLIGASSGAVGVLLPSISSYYLVDKSVLGLLFLTSSVGYFLAAFGSGYLLEQLGMRRFLMLGAFTFLIGTLTLGLKPPFTVVLATRFLFGFGIAIIETGLNAYILTLPRNTSLMNSLHAFYGAGALIGPLIAAALITANWGWNSVYLLLTMLSLPLLLGFAVFFTRQSSAPSHQAEKDPALPSVMGAVLRLPGVWWASLFLLIYVGVEVSLGNWSYSFLVEGRHQQIVLSSWIVSGYWLGLTLGRFTLAAVTERLGIGTIGLITRCIIGTAIGTLVVWFLPLSFFAAPGFCWIGFCLGPIYPTTVALMPTIVPNRLIASAVGFLVSSSILGIALFPWLAGILAQQIGIASLLPYALVLTCFMLLSWWILFRSPTATQESTSQEKATVLERD
ncbi:MAG: MFS transporter [Chloroflexota bacterium]|nr:MFS transporter [Chloroflexota bacterium]